MPALKMAFYAHDVGREGKVGYEECQKVLSSFGLPLTLIEDSTMFNDNRVDYRSLLVNLA